ncbi:uncharacterized protein LOC100374447 [Saccoglossus kowalevskii]|uniref:Uncharacterized protein LOC100374447 n=1 Tax=Saccoglossus kowalevskii TaxID=10224 RepID=A0ABM0H101_SACKO|nr:PREDICTED: uncharacterized protein LOC100374447 [Saccoglossus kowalevskii]
MSSQAMWAVVAVICCSFLVVKTYGMDEEMFINKQKGDNTLPTALKRSATEITEGNPERDCYLCLGCMVRVADWRLDLQRCLQRACNYKRCPLFMFDTFNDFASQAAEWYAESHDTGVAGVQMAKIFAMSQYEMFVGNPYETANLYSELESLSS